jgi:photosystem II stability/assembly factor-like uncharacterized protein
MLTSTLFRAALLAVVIVIVIVIAVGLNLFMSQAHVLLQTDQSLMGSVVYLDGKRVLTIERKANVLHLQIGKHTIEARHRRYGHAQLRYDVLDDEQGSRERLLLRRETGRMVLIQD